MEKLVYCIWPPASVGSDRAATRDLLIKTCAPKLLALNPDKLIIQVADPESKMKSPSPFGPKEPPPICGTVDLWIPSVEQRGPFEDVLRQAGCTFAGYLVDESVYKDYGDNRHSGPRCWPDGQRSPGVGVITILERPKRLQYDEWIRRWHGTMSPVSEAIQPRTRYVRNRIVKPVTENAPAFDGIVVEMWPSVRHVTNPFRFFGARTPIGLVINMVRILRAVTNFHDLTRVRTTPAGEYFLKTSYVNR
jgi:hypothetical protein